MILLFGNKASKTASSANKSNNVKNNPVENAGILAMTPGEAKSLLTMGEYDTYISSNPIAINYANYSDCDYSDSETSGFMGEFCASVAMLGGFSDGGCDCGGSFASAGTSCSSFSSVG
ncbi:hypothetical protein IJ541_09965 [bacterium]|nr:hypothetical protein [bacterium]